MPIKPLSPLPVLLLNDFFRLQITQSKSKTIIKMVMLSNLVNTKNLSQTTKLLSENLPRIYSHKCFNYLNASFSEEVRKTEIGHLFEHILLENISELKKTKSNSRFILEGKTSWDWHTEKVGVFHIDINIGSSDEATLYQALERSIKLIKQILRSKKPSFTPLPAVVSS